MRTPVLTASAVKRCRASSDPSHQTTLSGLQRSVISVTQRVTCSFLYMCGRLRRAKSKNSSQARKRQQQARKGHGAEKVVSQSCETNGLFLPGVDHFQK